MKIFRVIFEGVYPVGNCLIIAAHNLYQAQKIAEKTILHTKDIKVFEVNINEQKVIEYLNGDYF